MHACVQRRRYREPWPAFPECSLEGASAPAGLEGEAVIIEMRCSPIRSPQVHVPSSPTTELQRISVWRSKERTTYIAAQREQAPSPQVMQDLAAAFTRSEVQADPDIHPLLGEVIILAHCITAPQRQVVGQLVADPQAQAIQVAL